MALPPLPIQFDTQTDVLPSTGKICRFAGLSGKRCGLVRFAQSFDEPQHDPVLAQESIDATFAIPGFVTDRSAYYACGWMVRPTGKHGQNTWHSGGLSGTSTLMVRLVGGIDYAVLFNQSDDPSGLDYGDIDDALHTVIDPVQVWPSHDLFPKYNGAT